ncbi:MAG: NADH-quinone oxidoreductase subunit C [Methanosarcinales archaeon]|nr:NADH-quinone oxidoreductase subunit C [ANME-2 cluster archaeon]MDW7776557.1 NADH-quinone oxidoreductase subunit C [Methanosarcinales archaeon]
MGEEAVREMIDKTIMIELSDKFPNAVSGVDVPSLNRAVARIDSSKVKEIMQFLLDKGFDHLSCLSGVDHPPDKMEVVYHITSYSGPLVITLKASIPRDDPKIDSLCDIYWNANWYERETYELFGIIFNDCPYLKVLLLPEDMEGEWPLRKDYAGYPNPT